MANLFARYKMFLFLNLSTSNFKALYQHF
uniref:Uncharacterized protein n=1 Tax=Anguilla anguilla TaxID=7936 RepID=A0A0E9VNC1_ANGAN